MAAEIGFKNYYTGLKIKQGSWRRWQKVMFAKSFYMAWQPVLAGELIGNSNLGKKSGIVFRKHIFIY